MRLGSLCACVFVECRLWPVSPLTPFGQGQVSARYLMEERTFSAALEGSLISVGSQGKGWSGYSAHLSAQDWSNCSCCARNDVSR